jgi:hypothetical protein
MLDEKRHEMDQTVALGADCLTSAIPVLGYRNKQDVAIGCVSSIVYTDHTPGTSSSPGVRMSLSERLAQGKKSLGKCANKTCQRLFDVHMQSPLCPNCTKIVKDELAERLLKNGYGIRH